ncbi:MAG TPA: 16S rRNA (adenine(1518)-N(6)/adenine(1519)-N(6))-dimethyltransferase RsmA [Solirubrobacteraceae bacterium]
MSGLVAEEPRPGRARAASAGTATSDAAQPVQPSLRRLRQFGIHPNRELGQNFLIDSNILGVIGREAALDSADVVLEIGGGLGVLSEYLAERVGYVHVIEIDRRLEDALADAVGECENATVWWGDVMGIDLAGLRPAPTKVVANLPYGVAGGALLRTIEELPGVDRWVGMAQREVGERLAAKPGNGTYGVPSVLAQLACEVGVLRSIPRTVFHPVPNVDSVLVGMSRRGPAASGELRGLVNGAFAHRRKTLVGSLALSGRGSGSFPPRSRPPSSDPPSSFSPRSREDVRSALERLGHPADVRAERLSPEDFRALGRLLEL